MGTNVSLGPNHNLNVTNATTIPVADSLSIDGGTFKTGNVVVNGTFGFNSGTLGITGPDGLAIGVGGPLGSTLLIDPGRVLHVTNTLTVNSGGYLTEYSVPVGQLTVGNLVNNGDFVLINTAFSGPVVNNHAVTVVGTSISTAW